jgi:hypothetical protein
MASNVGQFSAWRRFVRAPLQSDDRDYHKIAIEHRVSNARQSDAGLSHEFQTRPGTDINAVNAVIAENANKGMSEDVAVHKTTSSFQRYAIRRPPFACDNGRV